MTRFSHRALGAAAFALCAMSIATPASAGSCWTAAEISAAKVHEMQTRLMVAALGCRAGGIDSLASYDKFIAAKRNALSAAQERLKQHFQAAAGDAGDSSYDRYAAALAQAYGAAPASYGSCAEAAALASEVAASHGDLAVVADRIVPVATLPTSACRTDTPLVFASK